jgi:hypothetical protein
MYVQYSIDKTFHLEHYAHLNELAPYNLSTACTVPSSMFASN